MNTCTRVTVWHVAFHRPGPPVVLASTRDTLPRGIPYVYAPRLFNGGRSVALKRYKKNLSSPKSGKTASCFLSGLSDRLFYGTLRQLPWEEFDRFVRNANTEFPNVRLRFDFWAGCVCARVGGGTRDTTVAGGND